MDYIGKSKESNIDGTIELSGTVSQLKADDDGKVELDFNKDVRFEMTVKPKPVDLSIVKKGIQKDVANNKITYQVTVSTEEGTQGTPVASATMRCSSIWARHWWVQNSMKTL